MINKVNLFNIFESLFEKVMKVLLTIYQNKIKVPWKISKMQA